MIRQRGKSLQVMVYAGQDPLTGRKKWVSRQVPGTGRAAMSQAKQIEGKLLAQVAVGPGTLELLRARRPEQAQAALACGVSLMPDAYVFSHEPDGSKPIRPDSVSHRFTKLARRLGVHCRLHDLRHFMVTQLIVAGVDVRTVSGHAATSTAAA